MVNEWLFAIRRKNEVQYNSAKLYTNLGKSVMWGLVVFTNGASTLLKLFVLALVIVLLLPLMVVLFSLSIVYTVLANN